MTLSLLPKLDAWDIYTEALDHHDPSHVFALFSGGNDSTVLVSWAKRNLGSRLDAAVFIDTGTAIPGVLEFAGNFCADRNIPFLVYDAGAAYDELVLDKGFPGPAAHRYAYVRLKERQVDALVRDHKRSRFDRIMLLTGVRRSESVRRMGTTEPIRRDGAQVWVAPLIDWTDDDMRTYRADRELEQSDVAAVLCRSGECNCGAFAKPGERDELRSLYPTWWAQRMQPLEDATGTTWGERPGKPRAIAEAGPLCSDCQLDLSEAA